MLVSNANYPIASAPGLAIPSTATFQTYEKPSSNGANGAELLLHSADHSRIDYTAREYQDGSTDSLLKHYVGVFDPSTKELKLVETVKVSVRSSVRAEDEEMRVQQIAQLATNADKRRALGEEFGTRKAKKALNALRDNAVNSSTRGTSPDSIAAAIKNDPAARAVLEAMAANSSGHVTRESMQAAIDADKARPKHNPNAKTVEDIYNVQTICGQDVLEKVKVKPWVEDTLAHKGVTTSSRFVSHRISELVDRRADDEKGAITRLKTCKYMLILLAFYGACKAGRGSGRRLPPRDKLVEKVEAEPGVLEQVIKRFSKDGYVDASSGKHRLPGLTSAQGHDKMAGRQSNHASVRHVAVCRLF